MNTLTHLKTSGSSVTTLSLSDSLVFCVLTNSYSFTELDGVWMMGDMTAYQNCDAVEQHWIGTCCAGLWVTCVDSESSSEVGGFFLFKAQVTHHTLNAACLNGSIAVLLYELLQNLLPPLRQIPPCMTVKCGSRNNEPSRRNRSQ